VNIKISLVVAGINLYSRTGEVSSFELCTSRNTPSVKLGGSLTPNILGKRGDVGCGTSSCFDTVLDVYVSTGGRGGPGEGGIETSKVGKVSITYIELEVIEVENRYTL